MKKIPSLTASAFLLTASMAFGQYQPPDTERTLKLEAIAPTLNFDGATQKVTGYCHVSDGIDVTTTGGILSLRLCGDNALRVHFHPEYHEKSISYSVETMPKAVHFEVDNGDACIGMSWSKGGVEVDKSLGCLSFYDKTGARLFSESFGARCNADGDSIFPGCNFEINDDEAIYGLGEFRDGRTNLRNCARELIQFNTQAAVPVLSSSRGWGILWDNPSRTIFENQGESLSFVSDYGKCVDYYVLYGDGDLDGVVSAYRNLTGHCPMMPRWALGFHQSRNRYATQDEYLGVARRMVEERIPCSTLFIDYHHWGKYGTGSFRFDEEQWPDLAGMLDTLHNECGMKSVVTIWPCFKPGTENYENMDSQGYIINGALAIDGEIYDPFNPGAAQMYGDLVTPLMRSGIDGWFLDGPEPDHTASYLDKITYAGPAQRVRNVYPTVHMRNFYTRLCHERPGQRHYMLTRCAWAGQQRFGTAVWSGDIPSDFPELALQVAAGLSYCSAGMPYWTTDIGGYAGGDPYDDQYREVFTRWFQYGTFCPIFRSHGRRAPGNTRVPNELWAYGDTVQRICTDYINLRYRLMPYIYAMDYMVSEKDYTPMRMLAFDFANDRKVIDCKDQFMYGPAFLVCPMLEAGATEREVWLPEGADWVDFWTKESHTGGQSLLSEAPIETLPLYVRQGSIIPQEVDGEMVIDIYPGSDAQFTLYEDDGETLDYQQGKRCIVNLRWDDQAKKFTLDAARGQYVSNPKYIKARLIGYDGQSDKMLSILYKGPKEILNF